MNKDEELGRAGWTRRFIASGDRLRETCAQYEEIGFEVHLEPLRPDEASPECRACMTAAKEDSRIVYVRRADPGEDLPGD